MDYSTEQEFGYLQILHILARRKYWLLGGIGLSLIAALLFTLTRTPAYRSSMQLIIEPNFEEDLDPADLAAEPSERQREANYATQLNLMRSSELLQRAVDDLRSQYPALSVGMVEQSLSISRVQENGTETRIVSVGYVDSDPLKAQRVLETLQVVYQDYAIERQEQRLNRGLAAINNQSEEARRSLSRSQSELKDFRQDQNVIDPQQQAIAVTDSLNRVLTEQQVLQAQYQESLAMYETMREQIQLSPSTAFAAARLSQSPRYQAVLNALQEVEMALAERRAIYTAQDPGVESLIAQRQNQLALLQQEAVRVVGDSSPVGSGDSLQNVGQLSTIDLNLVQAMAEAESALEGIAARQDSLAADEQAMRAELNQFPALIDSYNRLEPEVETQQAVLQKLLTQRELLSAQLVKGGFSWQVVATPQPGLQTGPNHKTNMLLGAAVGLILGSFAAFVREALDSVVRTPEELQNYTALPILGTLPTLGRLPVHINQENGFAPATATLNALSVQNQEPRHTSENTTWIEENYWLTLRDSLDFVFRNVQFHRSEKVKAIAVSALLPDETSSVLTIGLALSAARSGLRTIVVDANFRGSTVQQWLRTDEEGGLAAAIATGDRPVPISVTLLGAQIDVLPAGRASADPITLLTSEHFRNLIASLESRYDLVLVDSPSMMSSADALEIASHCEQVLLITALKKLNRTELKLALAMLSQINVIGIVASGVTQPFTRSHHREVSLASSTQPRELALN